MDFLKDLINLIVFAVWGLVAFAGILFFIGIIWVINLI